MAQAGTPLTASWLAARVFPLANNHILNHIHGSDHTEWEPEELRIDQAPWLCVCRAACASEPPRDLLMAE